MTVLPLNNVISLTEFERYSLFKTHIFAQYNHCNCGKFLHMSHEDYKKRKLLNYCSMNYEKKI